MEQLFELQAPWWELIFRGVLVYVFPGFLSDADSYAVTFPASTADHLRDLALAAALSVDITMKQKDY